MIKKRKVTPVKALNKLLDHFGSQYTIADALRVKQPSVARWFIQRKVPVERAVQIEKVTKGAITAHELRPDIFSGK